MTKRHTTRRRGGHRPPRSVATLTRDKTIDRLAAHLTTRDAHLLAIPPGRLAAAAARLAAVPGTVYYLDTGEGDLLAVTGPSAARILGLAARDKPPAAVTIAVIPGRDVHRLPALGIHPPDNLPHPFSVLDNGDAPMVWPVFLLDALQRVDPGSYARILSSLVKPPEHRPS